MENEQLEWELNEYKLLLKDYKQKLSRCRSATNRIFPDHDVLDDIIKYIDANVKTLEYWLDGNPNDAFYAGFRSGLLSIKHGIQFCPECGGSGYIADGRGSGEPCGCMGQATFSPEIASEPSEWNKGA